MRVTPVTSSGTVQSGTYRAGRSAGQTDQPSVRKIIPPHRAIVPTTRMEASDAPRAKAPGRTSSRADFLAHLIAGKLHMPQSRSKRQAPPEHGAHRYQTARQTLHDRAKTRTTLDIVA